MAPKEPGRAVAIISCTGVPLLKHTPLEKKHPARKAANSFAAAASIVNAYDAPSHQRTPTCSKDRIVWQKGLVPLSEGLLYTVFSYA